MTLGTLRTFRTATSSLRALAAALLLVVPACRSSVAAGGVAVAGEADDRALAAVPEPRHLTLDEVQARLGRPGVHVFDANPREMYDGKHVPGARWVEWNHVTASDLPADRAATLIFYCALEACSASTASAKSAMRLGYENVYTMPQGILGWKKAGKPIETSSPTNPS